MGPDGWINFDCSPTLIIQKLPIAGSIIRTVCKTKFSKSVRYGDIVRGLPVGDHTAKGVYCSHVLEHLSLHDLRVALRNTHRILLPGGIFRMVLPDLRHIAAKYVGDETPAAAIDFMKETMLGKERRARGFSGLLRTWIGNADHLWLWDYQSLSKELIDVGFSSVRRAYFQDSLDPCFNAAERADRWHNTLGIECRA